MRKKPYNNRSRRYVECQHCHRQCLNHNGVTGNYCTPECREAHLAKWQMPEHQRRTEDRP